jgi:adenylate cyclase class IV
MRTEMRAIDEPAHYYLMLRRHIEDSGIDVVEKSAITDYENIVNIILQLGFKPIGESSRRRQEIDMGNDTFIYLDYIDGKEEGAAYAKIESILKDGESTIDILTDLKKTFATLGETDIVEY